MASDRSGERIGLRSSFAALDGSHFEDGGRLVLAHSPELLKWHKQWSPWYMTALQTLMFMLALRQFFLLDLRRDAGWLLLAGALFAGLKWQATQLYARGVVELVLWQMGG